MTIVTMKHVTQYCRARDIEREELTTFTITNEIGFNVFDRLFSRIFSAFPDRVTEIGESAFFYCTALKFVTIPRSITMIGDGAFEGCYSLTSISLPDGIPCIGSYFFKHCHRLRSITIPDSVTEIGERAFWECTSLTSITIPDSVMRIRAFAFLECTSLTSITIPDGVTIIDWGAFGGCTSLTSITIHDSVTKICNNALRRCTALRQIICNHPDLFTNENIDSKDQIEFISTTDYLKNNYQYFLEAVKHSGFNCDHVSSKELVLIIKLHQENYHPTWNTIVSSFKDRTLDQIYSVLEFFNKTNCMPDIKDQFSFLNKKNQRISFPDKMLSMFFTATDHMKLSMTAKHVIFKPKKRRQQSEQEHGAASFCSIQ